MKSQHFIIPVLALGGALSLWAWWAPSQQLAANTRTATPVAVQVARVVQRDLPLTLSLIGRAEAPSSVAVKSRLDGMVASVHFAPGQPVRKGQLLFQLDATLLQSQVRQAQGMVEKDAAQLARFQADQTRNQLLLDKGFISPAALGQSKADLDTAQASLRADQASLEGARVQLAYARIVAPLDGVAGALLLPVGGAAKANDTTLVTINQARPMYVSASLAERDLPRLRLAMRQGPVAVRLVGDSTAQTGKVAFLDNAIDPQTGAIVVRAVFDNAHGQLIPGQFAEIELELETIPAALVVPVQAVETGLEGPYAFVINADDTVALRRLALGGATHAYQVVRAGLQAGERVVVSGQAGLRDGAKVTLAAGSGSGTTP